MLIKTLAQAMPYDAPNHHGCVGLRLQGMEPGGPQTMVVGLSHFLPGGGAGPDASPLEKVYVVLAGQLTLLVAGQETLLRPMDSCTVAADEEREIVNRGNDVVTMITVMPRAMPAVANHG